MSAGGSRAKQWRRRRQLAAALCCVVLLSPVLHVWLLAVGPLVPLVTPKGSCRDNTTSAFLPLAGCSVSPGTAGSCSPAFLPSLRPPCTWPAPGLVPLGTPVAPARPLGLHWPHPARPQSATMPRSSCTSAASALAAVALLALAAGVAARGASFVVERSSLRVTQPSEIAGAFDSAIGDVSCERDIAGGALAYSAGPARPPACPPPPQPTVLSEPSHSFLPSAPPPLPSPALTISLGFHYMAACSLATSCTAAAWAATAWAAVPLTTRSPQARCPPCCSWTVGVRRAGCAVPGPENAHMCGVWWGR